MKIVQIASIGLVALSVLAPSAMAQQSMQQRFPWMFQSQKNPEQKLSSTITLVQKLHPAMRSYPGVAADILGIRTGMTVAQAEAVAEKNYHGKPMDQRARGFFKYKEIRVWSKPFVKNVWFVNKTPESSDQLALFFGSPVAGNTLYGIGRFVTFGDNGKFGGDPASAPLASTLEASLTKKYGPPSNRASDKMSYLTFTWAFTQTSRATCESGSCVMQNENFVPLTPIRQSPEQTNDMDPHNMVSVDMSALDLSAKNESVLQSNQNQMELSCEDDVDHPKTLIIYVYIDLYSSDTTKAEDMRIAAWDPQACINDNREASAQLKVAAIKFYNTVSKAPAAPKM